MIASSIAKSEYEYKAIRQLGINILVQAAKDAFMKTPSICHPKHKDLIKRDALNWLTGRTKFSDLQLICSMAGISADAVREESLKLEASGKTEIESFYKLLTIRK